ncbi:MAG: FIVAR domain-containing protein [Oscillospiraceae bacterium]
MYIANLKLPPKGIRLIAVITALLCCVMALGTGAFAVSATQTVELNAKGSEAQLVMDFPQAAAEEIASMQISLVVSPSSDNADIEFVPESGLPAKIVESRYHSDTGVLTVYLAGTKALFSDTSPLTVGKIRIGGSDVSAAVKIEEGSIKFVRGSELVTPSGDISYPGMVTISTSASIPLPPAPPSSSSSTSSVPSSKPVSSTPSSSSSSESSSDPTEPNEPVIVPVEPADTSSLAEAVDRAGGYKRGDYTEDSYGTLVEALNKAKAVLSNTGSTQDEVDEALLVLENAIGMLTSANNAPSGTDGYGSSGGDILLPGSNNGDSSNNAGNSSAVSPEKPSDNSGGNSGSNGEPVGGEQNPSDSSQTSDMSKTDSSEKEESGNSAVMWIIIVMAVLVVTAAALVVAIKLKKK